MTVKLTAKAACEVARLHRDRFNEHVAAGRFRCAPPTIPGRARLFEVPDVIALCLFSDLMEDGVDAIRAGAMACEVGNFVRRNPDHKTVSLVEDYFRPPTFHVMDTDSVPLPSEWGHIYLAGSQIRKVTTFNIEKTREIIDRYIEEQRSIVGDDD